jgi:predicted nuclease with TOPRIM domain
MTSKEKAIELVDKFLNTENEYKEHSDYMQSKQSALISVDETIKALNVLLNSRLNNDFDILKLRGEYMELKSEIEKL